MTFNSSENFGDFTPTVKNTFIDFEFVPLHDVPRRRSVPASQRLCQVTQRHMCNSKLLLDDIQSDVSTHETESSTCSESGTRTPMSLDDPSPTAYTPGFIPQAVWFHPQTSWTMPAQPLAEVVPPPKPHTQLRRAAAFKPKDQATIRESEPNMDHYRKHIAEVIRLAKVAIKYSQHVKEVEISEDAGTWSVVIQPRGSDDNEVQTELLMTLAQEALLDAAAKSKAIYVMGYCGPKPFNMRPQGFEATLGAMQSATTACWHIYKKGFCRHADKCCKQHPGVQVPVHVLVQGGQFNGCARFASAFKEQVANVALTVTAALAESPQVELAEAVKDKQNQGWTVELIAKDDAAANKEYLLTLAKNALFNATGQSEIVYIMGNSVKPFTWTSGGFVTILGDMQDESKVCWDLYSKGWCSRDCACKWEHPDCLMPINVVVKEKTSSAALSLASALGVRRV